MFFNRNLIKTTMFPIRFVLERGQDAHDWDDVHPADVAVDDQVEHGQVELSLMKFKLFLCERKSELPCGVSCYLLFYSTNLFGWIRIFLNHPSFNLFKKGIRMRLTSQIKELEEKLTKLWTWILSRMKNWNDGFGTAMRIPTNFWEDVGWARCARKRILIS